MLTTLAMHLPIAKFRRTWKKYMITLHISQANDSPSRFDIKHVPALPKHVRRLEKLSGPNVSDVESPGCFSGLFTHGHYITGRTTWACRTP